MNNLLYLFVLPIVIILFVILLIAFLLWKKNSNKKYKLLKKIPQYLKKISTLPHSQKILEYDKILDQCLFAYGHKGTTGQKMKAYGKNFGHQNNIWTAHKLRNRIAHEIGFIPNSSEFKNAEKSFLKEIKKMLKK